MAIVRCFHCDKKEKWRLGFGGWGWEEVSSCSTFCFVHPYMFVPMDKESLLADQFKKFALAVCRFSAELGFEDPNLTAMVSENLDRMTKRKQIVCP